MSAIASLQKLGFSCLKSKIMKLSAYNLRFFDFLWPLRVSEMGTDGGPLAFCDKVLVVTCGQYNMIADDSNITLQKAE